jgi:hypothetical protein
MKILKNKLISKKIWNNFNKFSKSNPKYYSSNLMIEDLAAVERKEVFILNFFFKKKYRYPNPLFFFLKVQRRL